MTQKQQQKLFDQAQTDWNLENAVKELLSLSGYNVDALFSGNQWEASEVLSTIQADVNTDKIAIAKKAAEQQAEDKFRVMLEQTFGVPSRREHGEINQVLDSVKVKLSQADPTIQNDLYATRQQLEIYKESLTAKEREIANVHNQYKVRSGLESVLSNFKTVSNMPKDWILRGIEEDLSSKYAVTVEGGSLQIRDRATNQVPKTPLGKEQKAEDVILELLKDRNLIEATPVQQKPKDVPLPQGQNVTTTQPATQQLTPERLAHLQRAQARLNGQL